jgi:hypothetical protein
MKQLYLICILTLSINISFTQYYLLPVVKNGQNPSNLNTDYENQQGAGLTSGWTTILQGFQPAGNWSSTFAIPFKFYFNGALVTKYKASTSGIVTFNTKLATRTDSNNIALPTSRVPDSSVCIWGIRAAMGDYIVTKTFGKAPHRQLWISFNSFSELNLKTGWIFASVVLEESTNKIFIVDQRTVCLSNNVPCTDKTSLTLGIQIDSTNAIMVPGSPDYQSENLNNNTASDNSYYEFIPEPKPDVDVESQKHVFKPYYLIREFPLTVNGVFKNIGNNPINKVTYNYSVDNGPVYTDTISGLNVAPYEEFQLKHKDLWNTSDVSYNTHSIKSWISQINDMPASRPFDDTLTSSIIVNDTFITRNLLHETFTSSSSLQSKSGNDTLHSVLNKNKVPGNYTELNYHMGSPQGGDPYFTIEAAARSRYYGGIFSIPTTEIDGTNSLSPLAYTNELFAQYQGVPSFYQIFPSGSVKDQKIDITLAVRTEAPTAAKTKLFVAICEKTTTKNVKTNGETIFPHVMKKLLPDTLGFDAGNLNADFLLTKVFSWTVPGNYRLPADGRANNIINLNTEHSIEDFSNLEIIAWLQDSNRNVLQSNSANLQYIVSNVDPVSKKQIRVIPNPASNYFFIDMSAFDVSDQLNILIADVNGKLIYKDKANSQSMFIHTSNWKPGFYFIKITGNHTEAITKLVITD